MDLFSQNLKISNQPLAEQMRPQSFDQLVGQESIFSKNAQLLKRLKTGRLQSLILWGPPGCGKTSFAKALIHEVQAKVFEENAIDLGAKKIREIGEAAKKDLIEFSHKTVLFIDEIHRLNRGQQDVLLPFVEKGFFYLIGATTENPSYQLNAALVSRCRLLVFEGLSEKNIEVLAHKALKQAKVDPNKVLENETLNLLIQLAHGDARKLYNMVEEIIFAYQEEGGDHFPLNKESLEALFSASGMRFDRKGDEHYDTISAFIKSIRGSDPDASVYYLARMLEGGEDPLFIARRLVILASEDIGNADPQALEVAINVLKAVELVGMPEGRINLSQAVTYLASAPKSNESYKAINKALAVVKKTGPLSIPKAFRSSQSQLMKNLGHGEGYKYTQEGETGWLPQDYFPAELEVREFYTPSNRGFEKRIRDYLAWMRGQTKK